MSRPAHFKAARLLTSPALLATFKMFFILDCRCHCLHILQYYNIEISVLSSMYMEPISC